MNKRGMVLIICYMVIMVLSILGAAFLARSFNERSVTSKYLDSTQAFWAAEAGVSQAMVTMEDNDWVPVNIGLTSLPEGGGQYLVEKIPDTSKIWAYGYFPSQAACRVERIIELDIPFYGGVLYVVGDIDISGGAYSIDGNVVYGGEANPPIIPPPPNITGTVTYDPLLEKLDSLKFDQLRLISQSQGNYHDATSLNGPFPADFWYTTDDDGVDNDGDGTVDESDEDVPNVVFLDGALTLKGGDSVSGFFVVGGEAIYDTTFAGNVNVNGCIYTQGDFTVLGGGGTMNVTGGIWVGDKATLKGGITLEYNADYLRAVQDLGMNETRPKILWREAQNPF